jgi:hypothetical protein
MWQRPLSARIRCAGLAPEQGYGILNFGRGGCAADDLDRPFKLLFDVDNKRFTSLSLQEDHCRGVAQNAGENGYTRNG